jgi:hypothetical protein
MPNFWSNTRRKVYEIFHGPKTKDIEFDLKIDQLQNVESSVDEIKLIYMDFYHNTKAFKYVCRQISENLSTIYDQCSPYWSFTNEIVQIYVEAEKLYDNLIVKVKELQKIGIEWDNNYKEIFSNILKREEARRNYDHYDD